MEIEIETKTEIETESGNKIKTKTKKRKKNKNNKPDAESNAENGLFEFAKKIKYEYGDISFLKTALTHTSYANEMRAKGFKSDNNQRLEFLGDSVLSLVTSEYIYNKLAEHNEGELTRIRAIIVCEDSLFRFADSIELGEALFLGHGEIVSNGRKRKSILADAFEALLGSVFLDGGFGAAKKFLLKFIEDPIADIVNQGKIKDYKSLLQQIIQQGDGEILEYVLISDEGPAHEKVFVVHALLDNNIIGEGNGSSKKEAEQNAAQEAMALFGY